MSRMRANSAGLVRYRVRQEELDERAGLLRLVLDAEVCVPKNPADLKEVVYIDWILSADGESVLSGTRAIEAAVSESDSFLMVGENRREDADYVISGEVRAAMDTIDVAPRERSGGPGRQLVRLDMVISLTAQRVGQGDRYVEQFKDSKKIPIEPDPDARAEREILKAFDRATRDLLDQLIAARPGASGARSPKPASPSW
jgi:hypothetical protein